MHFQALMKYERAANLYVSHFPCHYLYEVLRAVIFFRSTKKSVPLLYNQAGCSAPLQNTSRSSDRKPEGYHC